MSNYDTINHPLWIDPIEIFIAIKCKDCGCFFDENLNEITEKYAYDNYDVQKGYCDNCLLITNI